MNGDNCTKHSLEGKKSTQSKGTTKEILPKKQGQVEATKQKMEAQ